MKLYIGITDTEWFRYLRSNNADEMNFWRPRATSQFKALAPGGLFLFKSKYPHHRIVGGAFFVRHTTLNLDLAWKAFGTANGTDSLEKLRRMIQAHRKDNDCNPIIGCTILTQPFYLKDDETIDPPSDWSGNIVTGKSYEIASGSEGLRLFEQAQAIFSASYPRDPGDQTGSIDRFGKPQLVSPRLGQGGFRIMVMDALREDVQSQERRLCQCWRQHTSSHTRRRDLMRSLMASLCDRICTPCLMVAI